MTVSCSKPRKSPPNSCLDFGAHDHERELAAVYLQMARTQAALGNFKEADELVRMGVQLAERHNLLPQVADGQWVLSYISALLGRSDAASCAEKCIEIAEQLNDLGRIIPGYAWKASYHRWRGEYREAREAYAHALALALETNNRPRIAFSHYAMGHTHFLAGDWIAAAVSWRHYLSISGEVPSWAEHTRSMLAFLQGDLDEALEWAQRAIAEADSRRELPSLGVAVDWCASLFLRSHRFNEARRLLAERLAQLTPMKVFWLAYLHPLAAEAALALGDVAGAGEDCRQAEALAWMDIKPAQARLLKARGLVHAAQRSWDEAVALIREAVDLYRKIEQPYDLALCLEALADVLVRRGGEDDQTQAKAALREAVGIYQQLGAEFEVRRMQQASGTGGRPP